MPMREIDRAAIRPDEDWIGNNAAFTCPVCNRVFVVSGLLHKKGRACDCRHSRGFVTGGKDSGGRAWLEWDASKDYAT
jgi:hypothetical protein